MRQFYVDRHEANEAPMKRERKRQEAEDADRAAHPPDPRAISVSAAV
jgi:hypothetical protein